MRITRVAALGCVLLGSMATANSAHADQITGESGTVYQRGVTCATNSYNIKAATTAATVAGAAFRITASNGLIDVGTSDTFNFAAGVTRIATSFQHIDPAVNAYALWDGSPALGFAPQLPIDPGFTYSPICPVYFEAGWSVYRAIAPTRVLDTRPDSLKNYVGGKPGAATEVKVRTDLALPSIDAASAVAVNITVVDSAGAGFVQAYPTGMGSIGASSNLNTERAGQTIANAAVLPVGADGTITLYTQTGAHLLVDVMGYFGFSQPTEPIGHYVGKPSPDRVLDTRPDSLKNYSGAKPAAGSVVSVDVGTAPGLTAPGAISAAILNVTAVEATAPGYVQVGAEGALPPGAWSNLNAERTGQVLPNMVIAPVSSTGRISLYTQTGTHLIVDVIGVFSSDTAPVLPGGQFVPLTPERVLDTRLDSAVNWTTSNGSGPGGKPGANAIVPVKFWHLPTSTKAVLLNITGTEATLNGYVQAAALATLAPGASSNLNLLAGQTIPNAAVVPVDANRGAGIYTQTGTHLIADISGYFTN